jgi:hypothetical protein
LLGVCSKFTNAESQTNCLPCDSGQYAPDAGASSCKPCDVSPRLACPLLGSWCLRAALQPGRFSVKSTLNGTSSCTVGADHSFVAWLRTRCSDRACGFVLAQRCPPGRASGSLGQPVCPQCSFGEYSSALGATACDKCPPGPSIPCPCHLAACSHGLHGAACAQALIRTIWAPPTAPTALVRATSSLNLSAPPLLSPFVKWRRQLAPSRRRMAAKSVCPGEQQRIGRICAVLDQRLTSAVHCSGSGKYTAVRRFLSSVVFRDVDFGRVWLRTQVSGTAVCSNCPPGTYSVSTGAGLSSCKVTARL